MQTHWHDILLRGFFWNETVTRFCFGSSGNWNRALAPVAPSRSTCTTPKCITRRSSSKHLTAKQHSRIARTSSTATHRDAFDEIQCLASPRRASYASRHRRHRYYGERFTASSFAKGDIFAGDITAGEDPVVRQAAIDALGDMNGTAVVIDPSNGRILAMVNQKLALSPGAEPCSTIKLSVALAALSEGLVTRDTPVQLAGFRMNMTDALARSNNLYFEELGRELGFSACATTPRSSDLAS